MKYSLLYLQSIILLLLPLACHNSSEVGPAQINAPIHIDGPENESISNDGVAQSCSLSFEADSGPNCQLIHQGSSPGLYLEGKLLYPNSSLDRGGLIIDSQGVISCTGCDCRSKAIALDISRVSCPKGIISPGLINPHDHLAWAHTKPIEEQTTKYAHRNDWRGGKRDYPKLKLPPSGDSTNKAYGELRHILHATTSIAGSASVAGLTRNLDDRSNTEGLNYQSVINYNTFPLENGGDYALKEDDCFYSKQKYLSFQVKRKSSSPCRKVSIKQREMSFFVLHRTSAEELTRLGQNQRLFTQSRSTPKMGKL